MKTLVFGGGAIGSLFAGSLFKAGHDVALLGRENHVAEINKNGLIIEGAVNENIKVPAVSDIGEVKEKIDLIILATKSQDTQEAMELCKSLIGPDTRVLSVQNGIGNEEIIQKYTDKVIGGVTSNGVVFMEPGKIQYKSPGPTAIGNYNSENDEFVFQVKEMLESSDLKCEVCENIKDDIFKKFLANIGINGLASIAEVKNGELIKQENLKDLFVKIISEGEKIGKAKGFNCQGNALEEVIKITEIVSENTNSMLQDLRKGKKTEIDYFNGRVVEFGRELGIPAPYNEFITNMIKFIEMKNKKL
ncbi:MAG: 2-dehydropantoate 2-reductase [Candidatus Aenigmarchaeota archaeon]|nr:2-dehydropantoate 2-reductase [Candidatus Aenigmarchaeota archaeon]